MIYSANKNYVCSLCGEPILKGNRYWKKSKYTGKQHLNCVDYEAKRPVNITEPQNNSEL